jgi:hypothetical protein
MATYKVYFANEGVPASGLTLAWETLKKVSNGTDESSAPSFTETGGGWYKFSYSPTEDMVGVIDGSATLTVDADRYVPVDFSANDTAITETRLSELDAANLPAVADTIAADVVNIDGDPMRGTNNAALASVCTETRLAELDAVNLPAVADTIAADVVNIADNALTVSGVYSALGLNSSGLIDEISTLPVTPSLAEAISLAYMQRKNKAVTNSTTSKVETYDNAGNKVFDADITDDGSIFTKQKLS